jgi:penicillin-binding protein 1A
LTTAIVKSINTIPVRLAQQIGRDKIVEVAHAMGINSELRITRSLPLGASEVTVLDQTASYAVFASGGYKTPPYGFTQIITSHGDIIYDRRRDAPPAVRVLDEQTVAAMNGMLSQVPEWGTGRRAKLEGIKTAGKTGTASAYRDAWFVGYTGNYTAAVWMGNDDFPRPAGSPAACCRHRSEPLDLRPCRHRLSRSSSTASLGGGSRRRRGRWDEATGERYARCR